MVGQSLTQEGDIRKGLTTHPSHRPTEQYQSQQMNCSHLSSSLQSQLHCIIIYLANQHVKPAILFTQYGKVPVDSVSGLTVQNSYKK